MISAVHLNCQQAQAKQRQDCNRRLEVGWWHFESRKDEIAEDSDQQRQYMEDDWSCKERWSVHPSQPIANGRNYHKNCEPKIEVTHGLCKSQAILPDMEPKEVTHIQPDSNCFYQSITHATNGDQGAHRWVCSTIIKWRRLPHITDFLGRNLPADTAAQD